MGVVYSYLVKNEDTFTAKVLLAPVRIVNFINTYLFHYPSMIARKPSVEGATNDCKAFISTVASLSRYWLIPLILYMGWKDTYHPHPLAVSEIQRANELTRRLKRGRYENHPLRSFAEDLRLV